MENNQENYNNNQENNQENYNKNKEKCSYISCEKNVYNNYTYSDSYITRFQTKKSTFSAFIEKNYCQEHSYQLSNFNLHEVITSDLFNNDCFACPGNYKCNINCNYNNGEKCNNKICDNCCQICKQCKSKLCRSCVTNYKEGESDYGHCRLGFNIICDDCDRDYDY